MEKKLTVDQATPAKKVRKLNLRDLELKTVTGGRNNAGGTTGPGPLPVRDDVW